MKGALDASDEKRPLAWARPKGSIKRQGFKRHSRHEGLAPVRLPRLETGSGSFADEFLPDIGSIGLSLSTFVGLSLHGRRVPFSRSSGSAADRSDGNGAQASAILKMAPALHLARKGQRNSNCRPRKHTNPCERASPAPPQPPSRREGAQNKKKALGVGVTS
jgi:hypothetical protein